jgi:hypothetical protein
MNVHATGASGFTSAGADGEINERKAGMETCIKIVTTKE